MFRIISLNANGIRAAARKGFFDWMAKQDADVICIQETKAQVHQLVDECFSPAGYHCYYEDAIKKGYSGVAVYTRHKPKKVVRGYGDSEFDDEGAISKCSSKASMWCHCICHQGPRARSARRRSTVAWIPLPST